MYVELRGDDVVNIGSVDKPCLIAYDPNTKLWTKRGVSA